MYPVVALVSYLANHPYIFTGRLHHTFTIRCSGSNIHLAIKLAVVSLYERTRGIPFTEPDTRYGDRCGEKAGTLLHRIHLA